MSKFRTDRHNNPAAFTTQIAVQAGLQVGEDFAIGESFEAGGKSYNTAFLLKDPIETTIRVIDKISFYTKSGSIRWIYIAIPQFLWEKLDFEGKKQVIGFMYQHEGGAEMKPLFEPGHISVGVHDKIPLKDSLG